MRSWISRRSVSICASPGPPRKPKPPRWRSKWVQRAHQPALLVGRDAQARPAGGLRACARAGRRSPGSGRCGRAPCSPRPSPGCAAARADRVIDDGEARLLGRDQQADLVHLAGAEQRRRARPAAAARSRRPAHRGRWLSPARPPRRAGPAPSAARPPRGRVALAASARAARPGAAARARSRASPADAARRASGACARACVRSSGSEMAIPAGLGRIRVHEMHRLTRHDGRDGVLVDELRVPVAPQQDAEIVEPGDDALQLHAVDQEDRQRRFVLAHMVQERVLKALGSFGHCCSPFLLSLAGPQRRHPTPKRA